MFNTPFEIVKVVVDDVVQLQKISIQTFSETFSEHNTESDMRKYLTENLSINQLKKELSSTNSTFFFIYLEKKVLGYLKLNFESSLSNNKKATLEIERIYILKQFHGNNYGNYLLQKAIEIANNKKCSYIHLGVWEKNKKAISFYLKHNFVKYSTHIFKLGNDKQTDILMKLDLNNVD